MILTESHIIKSTNELKVLTFKTKNLYNKANYIIRQEFISNGKYLSKFDMFTICKDIDEYKCLPARVARGVLRILDANWLSFFSCIKKWGQNKSLFKGKPNLPKYLDKNGAFTALFFDGAILRNKKKDDIGFSSLKLRIKPITKNKIIEVQIVPLKNNKHKINIIYDYKEEQLKKDNKIYMGIDLGLNNLMAITSNKKGFQPYVVNGRPLKSINQYFNKRRAGLVSILSSETKENKFTSRRLERLSEKRNNKINDYLHKASHYVITKCIENDINTIIIGYNEFWKQKLNLGKVNNQNFISIPYERLINMFKYKCEKYGINLILNEESYTSKCSFLDNESITKHDNYLGKRIKRGLFISKNNNKINADLNGSYNIIKKVVPNAFSDGIEGVAVHPISVSL